VPKKWDGDGNGRSKMIHLRCRHSVRESNAHVGFIPAIPVGCSQPNLPVSAYHSREPGQLSSEQLIELLVHDERDRGFVTRAAAIRWSFFSAWPDENTRLQKDHSSPIRIWEKADLAVSSFRSRVLSQVLELRVMRNSCQHPGPVDDVKMPKHNAPSVGLQNEDLLLGEVDSALGARGVLLRSVLVGRGLPRPQSATKRPLVKGHHMSNIRL
jgi:hypothetical protein